MPRDPQLLSAVRPGFGSGRNRVTLTLDPLDPASMDALIDALVPGMPAAARAAVTGQAQGLPLFAVELIRSLIDRDVVQPVDGTYRLVSDIGELRVPRGLRALLAARLDARDQLTAALAVLREDPDADTVRALGELAGVEILAGDPIADALSAEAIGLGQALAVDDATLARLFIFRGGCMVMTGRRLEAASYLREAVRLAGQAGNRLDLGVALLNLADTVTAADRAAGAATARDAVDRPRQVGSRDVLAMAVTNLAEALFLVGDWAGAAAELDQAADADGLAGAEFLVSYRGWAAALRGDVTAAEAALAGLSNERASEDPQAQAIIALTEAFTAAARRQPAVALDRARAVLGHAAALGISHDSLRWAWPLAARAAWDLADPRVTPGRGWPRQGWPRRSPGRASSRPPTTSRTACSTRRPG